MTVTAVIMAGGRGTRMAADGVAHPKPLVPVAGESLMARSLLPLPRAGVRRAVLVVPAHTPAVVDYARRHRAAWADRLGLALTVQVETEPRGNIGAADVATSPHALVLFADNLTDLDLGAVIADHLRHEADLTLATHLHRTPIPFGAVDADGDRVTDYREKPVLETRVCSGIYVLGPRALAAIPPDRPIGASALVRACLDAGQHVRQHPHAARWVDVNDADALARAEALIREDPEAFLPLDGPRY